MKNRMAAIAKTDPLKGLPESHAKTETDRRGIQSKMASILFDGAQCSARADKRK